MWHLIINVFSGPRGGAIVTISCDNCKTVKQLSGSSASRSLVRKHQYCTLKCMYVHDEWCKEASERRQGDKHPLFGKHHSRQTRTKLHHAMLGKSSFWTGKINPWFESWLIDSNRNWSKEIKRQFGNQCAECQTQRHLHSHHIIPRSCSIEREFDLNNGICLCKLHHVEIHRLLYSNTQTYKEKVEMLITTAFQIMDPSTSG